jgi:hypothetical protein
MEKPELGTFRISRGKLIPLDDTEPLTSLYHVGVGHLQGGHSGRYPWGSGDRSAIDSAYKFKENLDALKKSGLSNTEIYKKLGFDTRPELEAKIAHVNGVIKSDQITHYNYLAEANPTWSNTRISQEIGVSEGTGRNLRDATTKGLTTTNKASMRENTKKEIEGLINEGHFLDLGPGTEAYLGINKSTLKLAKQQLLASGEYYEHKIWIPQVTNPSKYTTQMIFTKEPDIEVVRKALHEGAITSPGVHSDNGGESFRTLKIEPVAWNRIKTIHAEEGGLDRDGTLLIRRGVKDLDLGDSHYAQVRIQLGDTHYAKGMAVYGDDSMFPKGTDILFHTNKSVGTPREDVYKKLKDNPKNPFESSISDQKGALNIVSQEGDWDSWKPSLATQFLAKQNPTFIKDRLKATQKDLDDTLADINSITYAPLKKYLLDTYAGTDGNPGKIEKQEWQLRAKAVPGTKSHVLVAFPEMNPKEVYAPNYPDGTKLVLLRYPHGGIFELPEVTVNNKLASAKKTLGNSVDAIGIHPRVAEKLSGADFDGDTVMAIPNNNGAVKTSKSLTGLVNFSPNQYEIRDKSEWPTKDSTGKTVVGPRHISERYMQIQMGVVSNLVTDMTVKGATPDELARAVRHSMVIIDSYKHHLDYRASAADNRVKDLQKKYQSFTDENGTYHGAAASTLLSRAKQKIRDDETGNRSTTKLLVDLPDAHVLSSGTVQESLYADHINYLKSTLPKVKKEAASISMPKTNNEAKKNYAPEVASLNAKLKEIQSNAPKERTSQRNANAAYYKYLAENNDVSKDRKKKIRSELVNAQREMTGAQRLVINITENEYAAMKAGAIPATTARQLLDKANLTTILKYESNATTKKGSTTKAVTTKTKANRLLNNGATLAETASALGMSVERLKDLLGYETNKTKRQKAKEDWYDADNY